MPRKDPNAGGSSTAQAQQDAASDGIDAYELPKSLVTRIARSAIPENAKLQKETVLALMKGSTVFINYLAATAHDVASQKQHKSVSASDVLKALELLDLGDMTPKLQTELQAYRDNQKSDKGKRGGKGKAKDTSESASARAKGKAKDTSESASARAKGKAKATTSPVITVPVRTPPRSAAEPEVVEIPDDEAIEHPAAVAEDEDEEMMDADMQDDEDIDDGEDEDEGDEEEDEELVDEAALEEEELRRDARGVDHDGDMADDD